MTKMAKLMISIRDENFHMLRDAAKDRGITIQELLRAVIVPDWIRSGSVRETRREAVALASSPTTRTLIEAIQTNNRQRIQGPPGYLAKR